MTKQAAPTATSSWIDRESPREGLQPGPDLATVLAQLKSTGDVAGFLSDLDDYHLSKSSATMSCPLTCTLPLEAGCQAAGIIT